MATIDMSRDHSLGLEEAKLRANQILDRLKTGTGIQGTWTGNKFDITAPAKGTFTVTATNVRLEIDLPFLLRPIKGRIEAKITEEFDRSLK